MTKKKKDINVEVDNLIDLLGEEEQTTDVVEAVKELKDVKKKKVVYTEEQIRHAVGFKEDGTPIFVGYHG